MKTLLIVLSAFLTTSLITTAQTSSKPSSKEVQKTTYVCPMHPKEMSMKEGKCSKCGMDLVKTTKKASMHNTKSQSKMKMEVKYVCKMDGTTSHEPGKCSKCGMALTKVSSDEKEENHKH